jgi:hypothetical protein
MWVRVFSSEPSEVPRETMQERNVCAQVTSRSDWARVRTRSFELAAAGTVGVSDAVGALVGAGALVLLPPPHAASETVRRIIAARVFNRPSAVAAPPGRQCRSRP